MCLSVPANVFYFFYFFLWVLDCCFVEASRICFVFISVYLCSWSGLPWQVLTAHIDDFTSSMLERSLISSTTYPKRGTKQRKERKGERNDEATKHTRAALPSQEHLHLHPHLHLHLHLHLLLFLISPLQPPITAHDFHPHPHPRLCGRRRPAQPQHQHHHPPTTHPNRPPTHQRPLRLHLAPHPHPLRSRHLRLHTTTTPPTPARRLDSVQGIRSARGRQDRSCEGAVDVSGW